LFLGGEYNCVLIQVLQPAVDKEQSINSDKMMLAYVPYLLVCCSIHIMGPRIRYLLDYIIKLLPKTCQQIVHMLMQLPVHKK